MSLSYQSLVFLGVFGLSMHATAQDTYHGVIGFSDDRGNTVYFQEYTSPSDEDFSLTNGLSRGDIKNEPYSAVSASIAAGGAGSRMGVQTHLTYGVYLDGAPPDTWVPVRYRGRFEFGASGNHDAVSDYGPLSWEVSGGFEFSIQNYNLTTIGGSWVAGQQILGSEGVDSSQVWLGAGVENSLNPNDVSGWSILSNGAAQGYYLAGGQSGGFPYEYNLVATGAALAIHTGEFSGLTYLLTDAFGSAIANVSMDASARFCLIEMFSCSEYWHDDGGGALPSGQFVTVSAMVDPEFWVDPEYLAVNGFTQLRVSNGVANASPVPEPAYWAMLMLGLTTIGLRLQGRKTTTALSSLV